jgi:hypothetical protein
MKPEKLELSNLEDYPHDIGGIARAGEGATLFCEVVSEDIRENAKEIVARWNQHHALKSAVDDLREELSRLQSVVGEEDYAIIEQKLKETEELV